MFFGRKRELGVLEECWLSKKFEFATLYGRRRVGKTEIIKKFLDGKNGVYFLCSNRKVAYNLKKFSEKVSEFIGIPGVSFNSFQDAFDALISKTNGKIVVVIDEFGYLIRKDGGVLSDFQEIVDEKLKGKDVLLILCGSSISMMETRVLGYGSPLYGRITRQMKVWPFEFQELEAWFPKMPLSDRMRIYSVTNGVAKYLEFFSGKNAEDEIIRNFFDNSSFLFGDAVRLLSEELRDYSTYIQILEAIALGYNKVNEMANYAFIQPKDVFFYIKVLSSLGIVGRSVPIFSPKKAKRGLYFIEDNYFNFWFSFISPFQSEIESRNEEIPIKNFESQFNTYLGRIFEREARKSFRRKSLLPFAPTKIGKWWHKDCEIDIVAANEKTKEICFLEVKWKDLTHGECLKILEELKEKSEQVDWRKKDRKEYFGIVAKSVQGREKLGKEFLVYELKDILA